nr:hemopexin [Misgurnus anguillicaudatus]
MRLLVQTLTLCLALTLAFTAPSHHQEKHGEKDKQHGDKEHGHKNNDKHHPDKHHPEKLDRCAGVDFDAAAVDEDGVLHFFKGDHLFKGSQGKSELSNKTFAELDDAHHLGHVDATFLMHSEDSPDHHDHQFFFLDNKVFSYHKHKLENGYPKDISEVFPGIPDHLDAAVQCHKPECPEDTVLFFKGNKMYHFVIKTKKVDEKEIKGMPNCTGAFRQMKHYFCLHGHQFSRFDPITGEVHGKYPKETRGYFTKCSKFENKTTAEHIEREKCSRVHLDAITSDDDGTIYAFRGNHFLSKTGDKFHSDTIENAFKGLHGDVDAVFSYEGHFYIVKDDRVFAYNIKEPHTPLEGFPKPLKEVLGIEDHICAAFVCAKQNDVHVIKGQTLYKVDMKATPRAAVKEGTITAFKKIDTAMCGPNGVTIITGNHFYNYESIMLMLVGKIMPVEKKVSHDLFGCDH